MWIVRLFLAVAAFGTLLMLSPAEAKRSKLGPLPEGGRYVAMGSSFAAGSGIEPSADVPSNRCGRAADNYAHQLARKHHLQLVDVSCGGAMTTHVLGPWGELPAQVDSLTADTVLVTITIGGNDVQYIGTLIANSCNAAGMASGIPSLCSAFPQSGASVKSPPEANEEQWRTLEQNLRIIAAEVRRRSPQARLVFVDYLSVLPERSLCEVTPLSIGSAAMARATAKRLVRITASIARATKSDILRASDLSLGHDACSHDPWTTGLTAVSGAKDHMPYHPNRRGMTMVADALHRMLAQ